MDETEQTTIEETSTEEQQTGGSASKQDGQSQQSNTSSENKGSKGSKGAKGDTNKLINSYSEKVKALEEELENIKRSKMTDDERTQYDIKKKEEDANRRLEELDKKQAELTERENRYFALEAVNNLSLNIKGDLAKQVVDLVMADTPEAITANVKAFETVVNQLVKAKVDETFKSKGRTPGSGNATGDDSKESIGAELGKRRAEADKAANDILKHYI